MWIVLFILVFVVLAATLVVVALKLNAKRMAALRAVAASVGLQFAEKDPFDSVHLPFTLFGMGDGQGIDWTMWGPGPKSPIRAFEFWYYVTHRDSKGGSSRSYSRFTCVLTNLGTRWPHLRVEPEGFLRGLRDAFGFRDIQFESDEFNRAFKVSCDDARFASAFVDPRMMAYLLDNARETRFEVHGDCVLCAVGRVEPTLVPGVIAYSASFEERIPAVVADLYPKDPR